MSKPYTMDDVRAWVEMRWGRERLDEKVMARIRATVEERDALKAQVADLEAEVVSWRATARDKGESSRKAAAERDALRAHVERAEKAEARVKDLEAQAATDDAHALVVNDAHLKTVAALRRRVAWLEAQWDEAVAALRELFDKGEGCAACGKAERAGCGCRYERARAVLAKYPEAKR